MKIGFVIYGKLNRKSGGYLYDRKLVEHLVKENNSVEIISIDRKEYLGNIKDNFSKELYEKINNLQCDLLLEDELCHPSLFQLNKRLKDIPIISIVHHLSFLAERDKERSDMYRFIEKIYLQTVDGFIFNSKSTRESVEELIGSTGGIIAYPGKDHFKVNNTNLNRKVDKKLNLLFVGNIVPHKCLDDLLEAILGIDKIKLDIVGNMDMDKECSMEIKNKIKENHLEDKVEMHGYVDKKQLIEFYKNSDLLVLPSNYEGYGLVIVEALAYGLPVIATNKGGPKEIIEHGKEGFLVEPNNNEEIKDYIFTLKEDKDLLFRMRKKGKEKFDNLPTWKESMKNISDYISSFYNK